MSLLPVQVNNPRAQRDRLDAARSRVQKARDKRAQAQRAFQEAKEADDRDAQRIAAADLDEAHGEIERAQELQSRALSQIGEAVASEWQGPLDAGAALAYYEQIVAVVDGKVAAAKGVGELNAALSTVIAGIWMEVAGGKLQGEFQLRPPSGLPMVSGLAEALAVDAAGRRIALPQGAEDPSEVEIVQRSLASKPGPHTFLYGRLLRTRSDPAAGGRTRRRTRGLSLGGEVVRLRVWTPAGCRALVAAPVRLEASARDGADGVALWLDQRLRSQAAHA